MAHISLSLYAIHNPLVLWNSSWICAYMMTFQMHYGLQIKSYYILNSPNQVKFYDKTCFLRLGHIYSFIQH